MRVGGGRHLYALLLAVDGAVRVPKRVRLAFAVPAAAVPVIREGVTLPARWIADGDARELQIDWDAALAQASAGG
jgi:hypothetical protein